MVLIDMVVSSHTGGDKNMDTELAGHPNHTDSGFSSTYLLHIDLMSICRKPAKGASKKGGRPPDSSAKEIDHFQRVVQLHEDEKLSVRAIADRLAIPKRLEFMPLL
jgi:hypothetical protein